MVWLWTEREVSTFFNASSNSSVNRDEITDVLIDAENAAHAFGEPGRAKYRFSLLKTLVTIFQ